MFRQRKLMGGYSGVLVWLWLVAAQGAVTVEENVQGPANTGKCIRIKNEYYELDLASRGGQAVSFKTRYSSRQWLWQDDKEPNNSGRLFADQVGFGKPAEMTEYRDEGAYAIENKSESLAEVVFSGRLKEGILLAKRYSFESRSPIIRVRYTIKNDSKGEAILNLAPQFAMQASGVRELNRCYRPYEHGVLATDWKQTNKGDVGTDEVKALYEGWAAVIQDEQQEGLLWMMEFSQTQSLVERPSAWTVGWRYEELKLPAGGQWTTDYAVMALKTFSNVVHASPAMVAGLVMEVKREFDLVNPENPDRPTFLLMNHTLCRSTAGRLENVKLTGVLMEEGSDAVRDLPALDVGVLDWEPATVFHKVTMKPDRWLKCVMTLNATGPDKKPVRETYEYYWRNPAIEGMMVGTEVPSKPPFSRVPTAKKQ